MNLKELRNQRKSFYSDCCKAKFTSKSNGLHTYYVCECGQKTTPVNGKGKELDLYGRIKTQKKNQTHEK